MNGNRKYVHYIVVAVLVVVVTLILKFGVFGPMFALPPAASAEAGSIDAMFEGHFWMISFLFALIMVLMLYAVVVFRRRPDDESDGPHVHGNTLLEIIWTIVPVFAVIGFGIWGAVVLGELLTEKPDEMVVKVTGRQWSWTFEYPEYENLTSAELVLPADQPVLLEMESEDVLHSFWVPEFRVKQDVVPGRTTTLRITPTETGEYRVRCAEICGLEHANMLAPVSVREQAGFDAWLEERLQQPDFAELSPAERGEIWYSNEGFGCQACHSLDGSRLVGPSWLGLLGSERQFEDGASTVADEAYIRNSILNPGERIVEGYPDAMPKNYEEQFAEREAEIASQSGVDIDIIADIIAYMETLEE